MESRRAILRAALTLSVKNIVLLFGARFWLLNLYYDFSALAAFDLDLSRRALRDRLDAVATRFKSYLKSPFIVGSSADVPSRHGPPDHRNQRASNGPSLCIYNTPAPQDAFVIFQTYVPL
jgi:hypothetical protein